MKEIGYGVGYIIGFILVSVIISLLYGVFVDKEEVEDNTPSYSYDYSYTETDCIGEVYAAYKLDWNQECRLRGLQNECLLDSYTANYLTTLMQDAESECIRLY
jgi:hypothetical protein